MSDRHDQHLDDLLSRWAAVREPSDERLTQLRDATLAKLKSARFVDLIDIVPRRPTHWRLYGALVAMAAAALFAFLLPYLRRADNEKPRAGARPAEVAKVPQDGTLIHASNDDVPDAARLDEHQLARKAKLLSVLRETFPDDLLWVSETEGEIHIGLRSSSTSLAAGERPPAELAIRIVVAARRNNQPTWKMLCSADVVTEPQELVEVPLDSNGGGHLMVWTCLLPDGLVAVDSDISLPAASLKAARGLHASASMVQREGEPCGAESRAADGWEYRVFQTVGRLPASGAAASPNPRRRRRS